MGRAVAIAFVTIAVAAATSMEVAEALRATRDRATALASFLAHGILSDETALTRKAFEIYVCLDRAAAFIHIFKAAGTTGVWFLNEVCPRKPDRFVSWGEYCDRSRDDRDEYRCQPRTFDVEVIFRGVNVTLTIVRDPLERFQSGVFELAQRGNHRLLDDVAKAERGNSTVADVVLDDLISLRRRHKIPDGHLMPQTYFLAHFAAPLPTIKYVAKVGPDFERELAAIASALGAADVGRRILALGRAAVPHRRDAHDPAYSHGLEFIRDEVLGPAARAKVFHYYREDYAWLGGTPSSAAAAAAAKASTLG